MPIPLIFYRLTYLLICSVTCDCQPPMFAFDRLDSTTVHSVLIISIVFWICALHSVRYNRFFRVEVIVEGGDMILGNSLINILVNIWPIFHSGRSHLQLSRRNIFRRLWKRNHVQEWQTNTLKMHTHGFFSSDFFFVSSFCLDCYCSELCIIPFRHKFAGKLTLTQSIVENDKTVFSFFSFPSRVFFFE